MRRVEGDRSGHTGASPVERRATGTPDTQYRGPPSDAAPGKGHTPRGGGGRPCRRRSIGRSVRPHPTRDLPLQLVGAADSSLRVGDRRRVERVPHRRAWSRHIKPCFKRHSPLLHQHPEPVFGAPTSCATSRNPGRSSRAVDQIESRAIGREERHRYRKRIVVQPHRRRINHKAGAARHSR